jgi:hypothetical protein
VGVVLTEREEKRREEKRREEKRREFIRSLVGRSEGKRTLGTPK